MRPISACSACRDRRKKCRRPQKGTSCYFCIKRGLSCTVEDAPIPKSSGGAYDLLHECWNDNVFRISPSICVDRDLASQLVDLYFRYIHVAFHNLFHQPSFEAAVREGAIPKILFLGVISLSARFSSHPLLADLGPRKRGQAYAKEMEKLVDFRNVSLTTIQACMLTAAACVIEGQAGVESIFLGVACRMALILDLPNAAAKTRIEQEINLRVWWSLVATDTWSSAALRIPRAIQAQQDIPMPMDEWKFSHIEPDEACQSCPQINETSGPVTRSSRSLFAHMIRLNQLLYRILMFNTQAVSGSLDDVAIDRLAQELCHSLNVWHDALPEDMRFTPEKLVLWAGQGCGRKLVILHLNYNYAGQLLFFRYLYLCQDTVDGRSSDSRQQYARRCKQHATNLYELIRCAKETPNCDVMYPLMGHALVIASTIHLFTLLFGTNDGEISQAKDYLERIFEMLTLLQKYWPNLDASFSKFKAFHQDCLRRKTDIFRLDQRMLRFILDYARPIDQRDDGSTHGEGEAWSLSHLGY